MDLFSAFWAASPGIVALLAFAWGWDKAIAFLHARFPGWQATPNFLSVGLLLSVTWLGFYFVGQAVGDPLAMDKFQTASLMGVLDSAKSCSALNGTAVLSMECRKSQPANPACDFGSCPAAYGVYAKCSWLENNASAGLNTSFA